MTRLFAMAAAACIAASEVRAGPAELWDLLRLEELVGIMADEGRLYGADLADQIFEQGGGPSWEERVADLYDPEEMASEVRPHFLDSFDGVDTTELETFFGSDLGRRIVEHELDARRAFLDPEIEAAASEGVDALRDADPDRFSLIREFVEVNDLVETNVASSLTFSYAFNLGLVDGGMEDMTESDALGDAWAQEEGVRQDTQRWLDAQLSLAFAPLSDPEIEAYVALSETEPGQALNAALFQAFEPTFTRIARGLGEAVAKSMGGQDI